MPLLPVVTRTLGSPAVHCLSDAKALQQEQLQSHIHGTVGPLTGGSSVLPLNRKIPLREQRLSAEINILLHGR